MEKLELEDHVENVIEFLTFDLKIKYFFLKSGFSLIILDFISTLY